MSESKGNFYQLLPWNFITKFHEGVVVQKDGILQRTFAYRAPDVDSSGDIEVKNLAVRVNDFAKRLGSGWAFHLEAQRIQIREYPGAKFDFLAPYLIDRERETSFRSAGRHFDSSYYLTFTWKPPSENIKKLTSMFISSGISGGEEMSIRENVEIFINESNTVASLLAYDLMLVPLDNEETVAYLHSTISFNRHPIHFPHTQIFLDRILPDSVLDNSIPMKLGNNYIPIVGINDFPDESYPAILDLLNRAGLEYRWVTRYICLDKEQGKKEAQKKEKAHRGNTTSFFQLLAKNTSGEITKVDNHGAGVKSEDSINAGLEIDNDDAALGYLTTNIIVWDQNLAIANKKADMIITIINSQGFTAKKEKFNDLESFLASLPGQIYASFHAMPVMTNTMAHIVPLSSVWAGLRYNEHAFRVTGVNIPHITCSTVEGTPFFLSLSVTDVGHASLFGPTGSGKSTILNLLEMQFFKYPGSMVIVFDKGRSCRLSCIAAGGLFYEPAGENSSGICFQPLRDLDTDQDILLAHDFIEACITVNDVNVTPPMSAAIKKCLVQVAEKPRHMRTITSFLQYIEYQDPDTKRPVFEDLLGDYVITGKFGKIFDSEASDLSMDTRFLALEMEALMNRGEKCIVPALIYLFNMVEKKFDGRLTMLVLDEAWLFLKNPIFADKIAEWLKVLRKKNVYVVFATQDVFDVANSPLKTTIIQQCLTKIYLADPSAFTEGMLPVYRGFGLTDSEIKLIASSKMKTDYFYTSPLGRRLFQLDLGPLTLALIGAPDHALLDDLSSHYEPGYALCAEILNEKRIKYNHLLEKTAPLDPSPAVRQKPLPVRAMPIKTALKEETIVKSSTEDSIHEIKNVLPNVVSDSKYSNFLDAVASLPERKKNDGSGRAAAAVAELYNVSLSTIYQARKILKYGRQDLIDELRRGVIPVKTAYKRMMNDKERGDKLEKAV